MQNTRCCGRWLGMALLSLGLGYSALVTRAAAEPSPPVADAEPITLSFFGIHIQHGKPWPPFPVGAQRLTLNWSLLEPQKGVWNFRDADAQIEEAARHNAELVVGLGFTPRWASSQPDKNCKVGPGTCWEPKQMEDWRDFVTTVGTRYKGRVHFYEIWNEPSEGAFYQSSVAALVALTRAASETLKSIDPEVQIVSPSPVGHKGTTWIDQFLQQGGGKFVDIIGFHLYYAPAPPESIYGQVSELRKIMANNHAADKPLWDTENSWTGDPINEDAQIAYLARVFLIDRAVGISRVFWFAWGVASNRTPLVQQDGVTLTAAGLAFQTLQSWLLGSSLQSCTSEDMPEAWHGSHAMWTCIVQRAGGTSKILWNPDGDVSYRIPSEWKVSRVRFLSGKSDIAPATRTITIGVQPVLLDSGK